MWQTVGMLKLSISFLSVMIFSIGVSAGKTREQALQTKVLDFPASRLKFDPGFSLVEQKDPKLPLQQLRIPEGFTVSVFALVPEARSLSLGEKGEVFVGTRGDRVYRVHDGNLDGKAELVEILLQNLNQPNGVAYRDGNLYVAEIHQLRKLANVAKATAKNLKLETLPQKFPSDRHHGWKFIRFGPDGLLYVPVGANCNVCDPGSEYARLYRVDVNSDKKEIVAQGIRNTVGFDWNPQSKELWFTDNGRDWMGEDRPPDEVNKLSQIGEHFGFPFCHGSQIQESKFQKKCESFTPPQVELPAHVAPLGMRFWQGQIIVAEHGSWNRLVPQGYRLSQIQFDAKGKPQYKPWIEGWLQGREAWGRPVDVEVYFDGSLLISDDQAGVIYRLAAKK